MPLIVNEETLIVKEFEDFISRTFGKTVVTRDDNILHLSSVFICTFYGTFTNSGPKFCFMKLFVSDLGAVYSTTALNGSLNEITLTFDSSFQALLLYKVLFLRDDIE